MSRSLAFDYNGSIVAPSKPVKTLRTVKKTFVVNSGDRDTVKYYTNGDFVISLPRVYENVVCIRLKSAEFPPLITSSGGPGSVTHNYVSGQNLPSSDYNSDNSIDTTYYAYYFLLELEGLNKSDETVVAADRSAFPDSFYAKIPNNEVASTDAKFIMYNDKCAEENVAHYTPALGKLDRLRIRTRLHSQQGNKGFIYWTTDGNSASGTNQKGAEFSLSFEIEYLDNVFDDFSSFETRITERGVGGFGC